MENTYPHTIALAGNPNVGKSTIFNGLTGIRQHTGNWPGKTVEKKEGLIKLADTDVVIVDLPGTYSLTAYSIEEEVARNFIIEAHPSLVIVVVDASNIERNLYLVMQVLELNVPTMLVLNMLDMAEKRGTVIHTEKLSQALGGIPVIKTVGNNGIGLDDIRKQITSYVQTTPSPATSVVTYSDVVEDAIAQLSHHIQTNETLLRKPPTRWLAIKLLEDDPQVYAQLEQDGHTALLQLATTLKTQIEAHTDESAEILITDQRFMLINEIVNTSVQLTPTRQTTWTDRIDAVVTHRWLGIPIFLLLMWFVFQITANVSTPLVDWIDGLFAGSVSVILHHLLTLIGLSDSWIASLLVDGVLSGVGGVLVFIPVLASLYVAIALLEDTGYMARAAFVMDRGMRSLGLHGKSFLPMLVGFGCTVPAVYATRTLENERERKLTGFLLTFMSCGARLPVYVVFGAAFLGADSGNLIFGMYLLGIVVALVTGFIIRRTVMRHAPIQPFVMELPPYRIPRLRDVFLQTWERTSGFIRKATSVILFMSVFIWFMLAIPIRDGQFNNVKAENSLFGQVSAMVAPVFAPAGFGNWEATGSLMTGIVAKEVIIGSMSQIYVGMDDSTNNDEANMPLTDALQSSINELGTAILLTGQEIINIVPRTLNLIPIVQVPELSLNNSADDSETTSQLEEALRQHFTPASAIAFSVFVLLYVPCMTTLTAMRHEFGQTWLLKQIAYTFLVAWVSAVMVYQIGSHVGGLL